VGSARHGRPADKTCREADAATLIAPHPYSPRSAANRAGFSLRAVGRPIFKVFSTGPPLFSPAILNEEQTDMRAVLSELLKNEDGATAIEYGLIAALISIAGIAAFNAVGSSLTATFNNVSSKL
jgi:pilus assembly protein Flp/PilA